VSLADPVFGTALLALLAAIAVVDFDRQLIPDPLNLLLAGLGLAYQAASGRGPSVAAVAWAAVLVVALWGLRAGYRRCRGVVGLGLGDVKMAGASALWISPWNLPILLIAACLSALLFVALRALAGEPAGRRTRIPFGPFIGAGLMLTWLLEISGLPTLVPDGL
jgi:prepilin signal peptidase PulO-like enzyme (type II secretory pathway)